MVTRRADVRRARHASRDRIVAAATELVRGTAYGDLTVDDVMREAGFSRTIFYRHFDDLADLLRRAGRAAFEDLYDVERAIATARTADGPDVTSAAIVPAVAVYERHGPLLRAIAEAAASDEEIAGGQQAMRERFDELVRDALLEMPRFAGDDPDDVAELARALNHLNVSYLLDTFGREPRARAETAARTLTRIWRAVLDPGTAAIGQE